MYRYLPDTWWGSRTRCITKKRMMKCEVCGREISSRQYDLENNPLDKRCSKCQGGWVKVDGGESRGES